MIVLFPSPANEGSCPPSRVQCRESRLSLSVPVRTREYNGPEGIVWPWARHLAAMLTMNGSSGPFLGAHTTCGKYQKPSFHLAANGFGLKDFSEISLTGDRSFPPFLHRSKRDEEGIIDEPCAEQEVVDEMCRIVIRDMDQFGVCVVDNFLGYKKGMAVLEEVTDMYTKGVFKDGQLVSNKAKNDLKTIRGDQITWVDGKDESCENIGMLISQVDAIILRANKMVKNGKIGNYTINGRTKAMVACYPGDGTHYVKHVDNPNRDGRCITAIYYLNKDWNIKANGGLLRIFPEGWQDKVADIEPFFDRILFFWSDRRNPHEVQPAFKTRYAITLWYFDASERQEACRRHQAELEAQATATQSRTTLGGS